MMDKFRQAGCVTLLALLLCGLVYPLTGAYGTGVSVSVSYSTSDSTTVYGGVNVLYANGTYDLSTTGSPTWVSGQGMTFDGLTQYAKTATQLWPVNNFSILVYVKFSTLTGNHAPMAAYNSRIEFQNNGVGDIRFGFYTGTGEVAYYAISSGSVNDMQKVLITKNSTYGAQIYVNGTRGTPDTTTAGKANIVFTDRTIDVAYVGSSSPYDYFGGTIYNITLTWNTGPYVRWNFNEGSGSVVYGYDNTANLNPSSSLTVSQTVHAVNSSVIITTSTPITNSTDRYTALYYSQRANSTKLSFAFTHYVNLTFVALHGVLNQTSGWYLTQVLLTLFARPYLGYQFSMFTTNAGGSTANPYSFYINSADTITAVFTTATSIMAFGEDTVAQWVIFAVALLFTILTVFYRDISAGDSTITRGIAYVRLLIFPVLASICWGLFAALSIVSINYGATFAWVFFLFGFMMALAMALLTVVMLLTAIGKVLTTSMKRGPSP